MRFDFSILDASNLVSSTNPVPGCNDKKVFYTLDYSSLTSNSWVADQSSGVNQKKMVVKTPQIEETNLVAVSNDSIS
jgi:hypothetical protein